MPEFIPPLPNFETLTTGLTDEEIRMEAVRIALQINERSCSYNGQEEDVIKTAKKIYDFIKGEQCQS